jgi:cyclophilin family peptidyl-prolyl cis-trans isomerase
MRHPDPFVRGYSVAAARKLKDTSALYRLARDADVNVASAAIDGLSALVMHAADSVYVSALGRTDSHLLMRASAALQRSSDPFAVPAIIAALERLTALRRETSRDGRVALLQRLRELGSVNDTGSIRYLLTDFDSIVAATAAGAIEGWTGARPTIAPRPPPREMVPGYGELLLLERSRVTIEMQEGTVVELALHPFVAPTNSARFARLAAAGYFNGLTFHRVAPAFVVQGGSPHANEYWGDGPFTRDELGLENARGSVGISTRGRDTGDGQMYFNLIDNLSLDHNYTVFATVTRGMEHVARMQEGARIKRVLITR